MVVSISKQAHKVKNIQLLRLFEGYCKVQERPRKKLKAEVGGRFIFCREHPRMMQSKELAGGLRLAALLEFFTGLGLLVDPELLVLMLLGEAPVGQALLLARLAGIALIGLGLACWPPGAASFRGLLAYNLLVTPFLAYLGAGLHISGKCLWPAVFLHVLLTLYLLWSARKQFAGMKDYQV